MKSLAIRIQNLSLDVFQPQRNGSNREKQETDLLSSRSIITLLSRGSFFFFFYVLVSCKTTCHKIHKSSNKQVAWFAFFGGFGKCSTDYCGMQEGRQQSKMEFTRCFWKWPEAWNFCKSVDACAAAAEASSSSSSYSSSSSSFFWVCFWGPLCLWTIATSTSLPHHQTNSFFSLSWLSSPSNMAPYQHFFFSFFGDKTKFNVTESS